MESQSNPLMQPVTWCSLFEHNTRMNPHTAKVLTIMMYLLIPTLAVAITSLLPEPKMRAFTLLWGKKLSACYLDQDTDHARPTHTLLWRFYLASGLFVLCITSLVFQALAILEWNFCAPAPLPQGVYVFVWVFFTILSVNGLVQAFLAWLHLLSLTVKPLRTQEQTQRDIEMVNYPPEDFYDGLKEHEVEFFSGLRLGVTSGRLRLQRGKDGGPSYLEEDPGAESEELPQPLNDQAN